MIATLTVILVVVLGLMLFGLALINALIVASDAALLMLSPGRAARLVDSEVEGSIALESLIDRRHRLRSSNVFISALTAGYLSITVWLVFGQDITSVLSSLFVLNIALVFMALSLYIALLQVAPRAFAVANPEYIALKTAGLVLPIIKVTGPIMSAFSAPAKSIITAAGGGLKLTLWAVTPEAHENMSEEFSEEDEQESLYEAVSDFQEKIAREVMTPRTDMVALEDSANFAEAVGLIGTKGVSRIPIYHETLDDIRGILYSKDLLKAVARQGYAELDNSESNLLDFSRPAVFVPETKPVLDLMYEMRKHTHMVIVADEYGGTSGLVTLEDLLEEIVGDISDEFDYEAQQITKLGEDVYLFDGRVSVDELNDLFDTTFDVDADSIGGLFTELVGHIPHIGESHTAEGVKFTVTHVESNRVQALRVNAVSSKDATLEEQEHVSDTSDEFIDEENY